MKSLKWFSTLVFATTTVIGLGAETRCPGNVASLPFRLVNHHQMIVAVSVNGSRAYDFLLDTGMQITAIDAAVAAELHLQPQGAALLDGAGSQESVSYVHVDRLEAGGHAVSNQIAFAYSLQNLHVHGILGENFLEHFDMLIDNAHRMACLDETASMRTGMKGLHIPIVVSDKPGQVSTLPSLPIVSARLTDATRPVRLILDSGADGAILYNTSEYLAERRGGHSVGTGADGRQIIFSVLPLQRMKIGSLEMPGVPFLSLDRNEQDAHAKGFDGILTFGFFRRVFICPAEKFVVLEP
jgi:predicted aspartyl protease